MIIGRSPGRSVYKYISNQLFFISLFYFAEYS